jgi:hypothetical protein
LGDLGRRVGGSVGQGAASDCAVILGH